MSHLELSDSPSRDFDHPAAPIPRWKRGLDWLVCAAALPFVLVIAAIIAAYIVIVSPGGILFAQERIGFMGRRFRLYKFRTMRTGADHRVHQAHVTALLASNQPMQKLDTARDTRLIPGGRLVRAAGLDELPQLLNVLRGEMSIVGPRPCLPYEYEQYTPAQRERVTTLPGLTGLWQVSGKNRTTFAEMIRLDVRYSATKSLWLDLKILALTGPTLARQLLDTLWLRHVRTPATRSLPTGSPTFQT